MRHIGGGCEYDVTAFFKTEKKEQIMIEIIPKKTEYEPYLEGGCELKSGIVDFRLKFSNNKDKHDFERLSYLITEAIANTVITFENTVRYTRHGF
jgi:hypothetical protein